MFNKRAFAVQLNAAYLTALTLALATVEGGSIVNGSFETPVVPIGGFNNYPAGSTAITGWTVVGVDSSIVNGSFTQAGITFQAQNGNQWIDLAGVTSNSSSSGVTQNIATTIGGVYQLSFYVGSATGGGIFFPATVDLSINGGARVSYFNSTGPTNMLNWKLFTVQFTATSAATTITFYNGSASNNFLSALDNVSVEAVVGCACPGDMNGDGLKNGLDIQQFTDCMIIGGSCICAEMDGTWGLTDADITAFVVDLLNAATCP